MNINPEVFDAIAKAILPADASDLANLKQHLQDSGFTDDELEYVMQVIDQRLADLEAGQNELEQILERQDVKDSIQSQIDSALSEKDDEIKDLEHEVTNTASTLRQVLVDSYITYTLILHKTDKVDFEDLDSSLKTLREELSSKPYTELNDSLSTLHDEYIDAFKQNPTGTTASPVASKDNLHNSDPNNGDQSQFIHSLADVLSVLIQKEKDKDKD